MYEVQNKVPIPKTIRPGAGNTTRKYPFPTMNVGEMFFVPNRTKNNMSTHASTMGKKLGRKFETKLTYMCEGDAGWELCRADDDGAVLGIGVWRTA